MESQSDSTQTISSLKLPMLKTGDYNLWSMRMEQYLTHTDYALWEVTMNGDAPVVASASTEGPIPPKTVEQKIARKNKLKAKSTLLLSIPDEHLLKFHGIKDAKSLWEAIKTRFGGNKESKKIEFIPKKMHIKGLLKVKPPTWNNIALIMRNKPDLDELSMDDLYNNLKVYEAKIKSQSSSNSNSQNVAFVSSRKPLAITNEHFNTALDVSTASTQGQASSSTYADDVMFSFFVNQSKSPLLDNEDMEQIDSDDLEEMDLKWQVAMLTMRIKRFMKKTRRNLNLNGKEDVGLDMTKKTCTSKIPANTLVVQDGIGGYDWSFQAEEGPTNFALMAHLSSGSSSSSSSDSEMVQKPVLNNVKKGTSQREVRQVWNNAMRVNHQNFSNSRRDFAPTAVLTKSGIVPISAARQSSSRAAAPASAARPINTVAPKPFVNVARPRPNAFYKSYFPSRIPFNQQTTLKNRNLNDKVNNAKVNSVNTVKGNKVTSVVGEQGINAVKSSAC
ncbi:hypothetical protein Tco_0759360 [Tanacetum coccineum]